MKKVQENFIDNPFSSIEFGKDRNGTQLS
uniref:Uncharacterized protein n=1 Tax=Rhizophora mucronata TaxID=61149 RepID=A0A2P2J3Q2_RHIMU